MLAAALSALQRQTPPTEYNGPRRRDSSGGATPCLVRRTLVDGMEGESTRMSGTVNDTLIRRDHTPWYPTDRVSPAGDSWVNWTAAGALRPELHMRTVNLRTMAGNTRSRALPNPQDRTVGLHTDPRGPMAGKVTRYGARGATKPPRQDRLLAGQYAGQSYSQTTKNQGAR
jgi:hypothetical protein